MDIRKLRDELGDVADVVSEETLVMGIMPDGLPMNIGKIEVDHHEDGSNTLWLHLEEF